MKAPAFLDTGAIYALADLNDSDHPAARRIYADEERKFVTHDLILIESFSLITKRLHKHAARQIVTALRLSIRIEKVPVSHSLLEAGWNRCCQFTDKDWDWIDCISFELMRHRGITDALSLDRHFAQAGFTLLLE
jgi:uncharacterized protein